MNQQVTTPYIKFYLIIKEKLTEIHFEIQYYHPFLFITNFFITNFYFFHLNHV